MGMANPNILMHAGQLETRSRGDVATQVGPKEMEADWLLSWGISILFSLNIFN